MVDVRISGARMEGEPFARYKKTIVGKVYVTILDPFLDQPVGVILEGVPEKGAIVQRKFRGPDPLDTQIVEVWDARQDSFFRKVNKKHFDAGRLMLIEGELPVAPVSPNALSDAELDVILSSRFLALQNRLNALTDEAPLFRLLNRARELEKSEKIIKHIEERLAEVQLESYGGVAPDTNLVIAGQ